MATVNPWKKFIGLLPGGVRTVGTVTAVNTARGTSTVELRNGISITARGIDVAVGSKAFIVDGQITGPAPLPAVGEVAKSWELHVRTWRPGKPHRDRWDGCYARAMDALKETADAR